MHNGQLHGKRQPGEAVALISRQWCLRPARQPAFALVQQTNVDAADLSHQQLANARSRGNPVQRRPVVANQLTAFVGVCHSLEVAALGLKGVLPTGTGKFHKHRATARYLQCGLLPSFISDRSSCNLQQVLLHDYFCPLQFIQTAQYRLSYLVGTGNRGEQFVSGRTDHAEQHNGYHQLKQCEAPGSGVVLSGNNVIEGRH